MCAARAVDFGTKRKASELPIPAKGEDAAERKRVLNVLAQRRYRQRRREHVKTLEANSDASSPKCRPRSMETRTVVAARPPSLPQVPLAPAPPATSDDTIQPTALQMPYYPQTQPELDDPFGAFDPNFVMAVSADWDSLLPSLPGSPLTESNPSSDSGTQALSLLSVSSPSTSRSSDTPHTFPDEAHLEVLELNILRAGHAIASKLNLSDVLWSLTATSPFADPSMALARYDHLPKNLRPTVVQMTLPHHPVFDILPWPRVREKLILVFSQPAEVRPPSASSPTALMELVYDLEDSAEGVRICGDDPYSDQSWEVGEKLFSNWWWAFDTDTIRRSNEMRRRRGAKLLGQGSILGEVT